jgi:hypothetical protein
MSAPVSATTRRWLQAVPWTACIVGLGLGLRGYHYLRDPSVWHDEAALVLNVLHKGFAELFGPLLFAEAAPPLFLWLEKAVTLVLGDGTYALRLVPFLASCASLLLFVPVARRLLSPSAVPWAVLLFACSDNLLWHTCEAKPYAVEVLCAVGLLAVYCRARAWPLGRQFLLYALLGPLLIWLAYPGCFLCGGLLVALLPAVWRSRSARIWLGYGILGITIAAAFAALVLGPIRAQRCPEMTSCWEDHFPPWDRPLKVPVWLVASTCEIGRYCCRPTGQALAGVAVVGLILFWRRGRRDVVALTAVPVGLALAASCLRAYPYGGTRVLVYAAPAFVLWTAEAVPVLTAWLGTRARLGTAALGAGLLLPGALCGYRAAVPWERADCSGASAYVLAHRRPNDAVAGNHWEYSYYFRHLGPMLHPYPDVPHEPGTRLWLVTSGVNADDRRRLAEFLPPGDWQPLEHREFMRTTVLLLKRPAAGARESATCTTPIAH